MSASYRPVASDPIFTGMEGKELDFLTGIKGMKGMGCLVADEVRSH